MKKLITESQLRARIASLEERMAELNELSANDVGQAAGQVAGGVAGAVAAPVRGAIQAGQAVADNAGKWWDAAKQGVSNFAQGAAQGAQQAWAATDPSKVAGRAAAALGATTAKYPTTPQEIKAFQQANGLTADGVIGPKTQAALAKAGLKPAAAPAKPAAAPAAAKPAAAPAQKPAAPAAGTTAAPAGQELRTPAEIAASQDLSSANDGSTTSGAAPAARNPNAGLTPDDPRWQGPKPDAAAAAPAAAPAATSESVTFTQEDSLARIIQLSR